MIRSRSFQFLGSIYRPFIVRGKRLILHGSSCRRNFSRFHPAVESTLAQINDLAPKFQLQPGQVSVLQRPDEFYSMLKEKIAEARDRIFIATLYIGKTEHELINCLASALRKNPDLKVYILSDALRGTREMPNHCSASLLAPLAQEFGERVQLRMYHTPELTGLKKKLIPQRINEGFGLQHMKMYGFDNEIILSGANLSNDYFTNRQDRYMIFCSSSLCDYFFKLHQTVASLSFHIIPDSSKAGFHLQWHGSIADPLDDPEEFVKQATARISPLLRGENREITEKKIQDIDSETIKDFSSHSTFVYPISQFSPLLVPDTSTEFPVISRILSMLSMDRFNWTFTAGYFNIHPEFKQKLLASKPFTSNVITAAPEANGFYKSKGISGLLPGAYSLLAQQFLAGIRSTDKLQGKSFKSIIQLMEWQNGVVNTPNGWSYHAKGIWITSPNEDDIGPCISVVGSSNYTRRSYAHDLEANVLLVTNDPQLQKQLKDEVNNLLHHTKEMTLKDYEAEDRKPSLWLRFLTKIVGSKL